MFCKSFVCKMGWLTVGNVVAICAEFLNIRFYLLFQFYNKIWTGVCMYFLSEKNSQDTLVLCIPVICLRFRLEK